MSAQERWAAKLRGYETAMDLDPVHDPIVRGEVRRWLSAQPGFTGSDDDQLRFIAFVSAKVATLSASIWDYAWAPRLLGAWVRVFDHFVGDRTLDPILRFLADGGGVGVQPE